MTVHLLEVMRQIERARKVDRTVLIEAIEAALISASRKNYGAAQDIRVVFNQETGDLVAYVKKSVVEEVKEPWREISLEEANRGKASVKLGDTIELAMSPRDFGRIAAQTAKQVMLQRVRESERNSIFEEFKKRQGELLNGVVLRMEYKNVIIDLGDTEAILPVREQVPREFYQNGDRLRVLVLDVRKTSRAPQVVVSRSHPGLIRKLFEMEVPEVADGVVSIKSVAREPGFRSKVAVQSKDKNVDPVGACVGIKGSRIQAIVREIRGEKIDVIAYSENPEILLAAALQPAKIMEVEVNKDKSQITVIVKDDQLSLAIGKNGQNVRLASKLTGWKIDILSASQNQELMRKKAEEAFLLTAPPLEKIPGISAKLAERLRAAGFMSVVDFQTITLERLTEVPGIGAKTAEKIIQAVKEYLPKPAVVKAERTAAELFAGFGDDQPAAIGKEKALAAGHLFAGIDQAAADQGAASAEPVSLDSDQAAKPAKPGSDAEEGENV